MIVVGRIKAENQMGSIKTTLPGSLSLRRRRGKEGACSVGGTRRKLT